MLPTRTPYLQSSPPLLLAYNCHRGASICHNTWSNASLTMASNMSGNARHSPQDGMFTLFPELATELRLKIWGYTIPKSRNIYMHVKEVETSNGLLGLRVKIGGDKNPTALSVYSESRKIAMEIGNYQQLLSKVALPKDHPPFFLSGISSYPQVSFFGCPGMMIDYERDNLVINNVHYGEWLLSAFISTMKIKNLSLDLGSQFRMPTPIWTELMINFPDLRKLNLIFSTGCNHLAYARHPIVVEDLPWPEKMQWPLITMDSNLVDWFDCMSKIDGPLRKIRVHDMSRLFRVFNRATEVKSRFWRYRIKTREWDYWKNLEFEMSFQAVKYWADEDGCIEVVYPVRVTSRMDLPRDTREFYWGMPLPQVVWVGRCATDEDGEMYSRYEGIEELFREV